MTKSELVQVVANSVSFPIKKTEVDEVVDNFLGAITERLKLGDKVRLREFGVFHVITTKDRVGHNPNDPSQPVNIPAGRLAKFRPSVSLKQAVRG